MLNSLKTKTETEVIIALNLFYIDDQTKLYVIFGCPVKFPCLKWHDILEIKGFLCKMCTSRSHKST